MPTPREGYFNAANKRIPSVTTVAGRFMDKSNLIPWGYERGRLGVPLYESRDEAANVGTVAHAMVEAHLNGMSDEECYEHARTKLERENQLAAVSAFNAYLAWAKNFQVEVVAQEIRLVSEKYQYGGTPDAVGFVATVGFETPQLALLDWKTSSGIYPDHLVQLAAYKSLWEENFPERPINGGYHLCRFAKDHGDFSHHYFADLSSAWRQFLLFREAYEIDKELKKRAA